MTWKSTLWRQLYDCLQLIWDSFSLPLPLPPPSVHSHSFCCTGSGPHTLLSELWKVAVKGGKVPAGRSSWDEEIKDESELPLLMAAPIIFGLMWPWNHSQEHWKKPSKHIPLGEEGCSGSFKKTIWEMWGGLLVADKPLALVHYSLQLHQHWGFSYRFGCTWQYGEVKGKPAVCDLRW